MHIFGTQKKKFQICCHITEICLIISISALSFFLFIVTQKNDYLCKRINTMKQFTVNGLISFEVLCLKVMIKISTGNLPTVIDA